MTSAVHSVVANFGGVDVLLNSAGVTMSASILELEQSEWDRVIAVNLTGAMRLGQAVARQMVAQKRDGSIIIVTSPLAEVAIPDKTPYLASKGGTRSASTICRSTRQIASTGGLSAAAPTIILASPISACER